MCLPGLGGIGPILSIGSQVLGGIGSRKSSADAAKAQEERDRQGLIINASRTAVDQYQAEAELISAEARASAALAAADEEGFARARGVEIHKFNLNLRRRRRNQEVQTARDNAARINRDSKRLLNEQIVGFAKGGVRLDSGSAQAVFQKTEDDREQDYLTAMHAATLAKESSSIEVKAMTEISKLDRRTSKRRQKAFRTDSKTYSLLAQKHYQSALAYNRAVHQQLNSAGIATDNPYTGESAGTTKDESSTTSSPATPRPDENPDHPTHR